MKPIPPHRPAAATSPRAIAGDKVFIPVTDAMLYDCPQLITAPLQPYQIGSPCLHWMTAPESPGHANHDPAAGRRCDYENPADADNSG